MSWLVVGLGNPGNEHSATRHNIGFQVADYLAAQVAGKFSKHKSKAEVLEGRFGVGVDAPKIIIAKPQTFMNLSGEAVGDFSRYYKIPTNEVIVILDDISLPLGTLRIRKSGSAGGHNGLESVLVHLSTEAVPRLRVGIGQPDGSALHDHVLGRFTNEELPAVEESVTRAADAFEYANAHGIDAAMNQFNQKN